jgi:hypothetical protein
MGDEDRCVPGAIVWGGPSADIRVSREEDDIGTFESENGDFAVGRSASEDWSQIVGSPGD